MYTKGDTVTITRGKAKGQATILSEGPDDSGSYAVRTTAGEFAVVSDKAIKAPVESTIGEGKLAAELNTLVGDLQGADVARLEAFIQRLSGDMPGLAARISWPAEDANEIRRPYDAV